MRKYATSLALIALLMASSIASATTVPPCGSSGEGSAATYWCIDNPRDGNPMNGLVVVKGYVLSFYGVSNIDLFVNNEYVSSADHDLPRDDVTEIYPQYAGSPGENPGFVTGFRVGNGTKYHNGNTLSISLRITIGDGSSFDTDPIVAVVDTSIKVPPFGSLETPTNGEGLTGPFPVIGWALDGDGVVTQVDVMVDGLIVGGAVTGDYRPDVENAFGMIPGADGAGFVMWLDTNRLIPGIHQVSVRVTDNDGLARTLGPHQIQTFNNGVNQPPFGQIDVPLYNTTWSSTHCSVQGCPTSPCGDVAPEDVYFVNGWALDVGSRGDYGSVAYVEMLFDGALVWNTRTDCTMFKNLWFVPQPPTIAEPLASTKVNCYGLQSFDVNLLFPGFEHSKDARFCFVVDVWNMFLNNGYVEGLHFLTIRSGDVEEAVQNIDSLPVLLSCPAVVDYPTIGYIDYPGEYEFVNGTVQYVGWVLDRDGIADVHVWVDGRDMGQATYGVRRDDVPPAYPNYSITSTQYSGFVFYLDTELLADSEHDTYVTVHDKSGNFQILGQRRIVVDNNLN